MAIELATYGEALMRWTERQKRLWKDLIAHLDAECPGPHHIVVVRRRVSGGLAEVTHDGTAYKICISPALGYQAAIDALQHEWSHVLAGYKGGERAQLIDHSTVWGAAFATVYQAFLRWNKER